MALLLHQTVAVLVFSSCLVLHTNTQHLFFFWSPPSTNLSNMFSARGCRLRHACYIHLGLASPPLPNLYAGQGLGLHTGEGKHWDITHPPPPSKLTTPTQIFLSTTNASNKQELHLYLSLASTLGAGRKIFLPLKNSKNQKRKTLKFDTILYPLPTKNPL